MRLGDLVEGLKGDDAGKHVSGFAIDHRKIEPGTIFGAFRGARFNAEDYIEEAISMGAIAVVARAQARVDGAVHIKAEEPRQTFAELAARYFAPLPAHIAAVTGTNGKTSTVELTRQLWAMAGHKSASIGTLGITTDEGQVTTGLTTPDIVTFLSNMSDLSQKGVDHVAFEASSHGLSQYRSEGAPVQIAAFTNLSRDHLDYHGDMDSYFNAKMRLFDEVLVENGVAVIWADDPWSQKVIARATARNLRTMTIGENGEQIKLLGRKATPLGQKLSLRFGEEDFSVNLPLIGAYQANNALTAAAIVIADGAGAAETFKNVEQLMPVRGRMEHAANSAKGAPIYVDYAHTPDGLAAAISAIKPHVKGQLITIFGAGGDRDVGKRPEMGKIASEQSDITIVTDDNPRNEDAAEIRKQIMAGANGALEIADRRAAIAHCVSIAKGDDIILIAGKGHEQGQIIGDKILPFDDAIVARECAA